MKNFRKQLTKFIFVLFIVLGMFFVVANNNVDASAKTIETIYTNPGEDCSTQMQFAWRSTQARTVFKYTTADDSVFAYAKQITLNGILDSESFVRDSISNYRYTYALKNLEPNTEYLYRIEAGTTVSKVFSFKTAAQNGVFDFIWAGDNHTTTTTTAPERYAYFETLMKQAEKQVDASLLIHSGDMVVWGGDYVTWQTNDLLSFMNRYTFAIAPGNHEFYYNLNGVQQTSDEGDPDRYFRVMYNVPDNGPGGDVSYWYIYNSVLFFALDALSASGEQLKAQKAWFEKVVQANEGKYQYIIVYQHYPWMNALTGANSGPYSTNRNQWKELFDKYGVDLALAGDHHFAYRSKPIYNDQIQEEGGNVGTVYVGTPQIGKRDRGMTGKLDAEYYAWRSDDTKDSDGTSGLTYFKVSTEGITGTLIDLNGNVVDTYYVKAKRGVTWEDKKDDIVSSYFLASNGTTHTLCYNSTVANYIKTIEVTHGDTTDKLNVGENDKYFVNVTNLDSSKTYTLKIKTTFVDGTSKETTINGNTYPGYGELYGLEVKPNGEKLKVQWNQILENDVIAKYKLFIDNALVAEFASSTTSYTVGKEEGNVNSSYTLVGYSATGDIIATLYGHYSIYGDANYDGKVNKDDVEALLKLIQASHEFGENEIRLFDQNGDGKVDIADATMLYAFVNQKIDSLAYEYFTVIVLDKDGNIISKQKVKYGDNATIPIYDTKNFDHWSASFHYVTSDLIIKGIYK